MQKLAVGLMAGKFVKFAFMQMLSCAVIIRVVEAAPGNMKAFKDGQRCGVLTPNVFEEE